MGQDQVDHPGSGSGEDLKVKGPMQEKAMSVGKLLNQSRKETGVPYSFLRTSPPN